MPFFCHWIIDYHPITDSISIFYHKDCSTIKSSTILTQYQVFHHCGWIKTFHTSHSYRNYFSSSLSVKTFLTSLFYGLQKSYWPSRLKRKPKGPLAACRMNNLFNSLKVWGTSFCLSTCYLTTMVSKMLTLTKSPPSETWKAHDITDNTKHKRKEEKIVEFFVHDPETVGYLPQATWGVSINIRIWAWGLQVHRWKPSTRSCLLQAQRKVLFKACHCETITSLKKTQLVTSSDRTLTLISNACSIKH